jgi:hypothetical protein
MISKYFKVMFGIFRETELETGVQAKLWRAIYPLQFRKKSSLNSLVV